MKDTILFAKIFAGLAVLTTTLTVSMVGIRKLGAAANELYMLVGLCLLWASTAILLFGIHSLEMLDVERDVA